MSTIVDTAELGRIAARLPAPAGSPRPAPEVDHAERVTISAEGRDLSRDFGPAVRGTVFWYSTLRVGRRVAVVDDPAETVGAVLPPPAPELHRIRHPHLAIDAYLRSMGLPA